MRERQTQKNPLQRCHYIDSTLIAFSKQRSCRPGGRNDKGLPKEPFAFYINSLLRERVTQNDGLVAVRARRNNVDRRADQRFNTLDVGTGVSWQFFQGLGAHGLIGLAARTAVVAGTATAVSGSMQRNQQAKAQGQYEQEQYAAQQQQAQIDAAAQAAAAQYAAPVAAPAAPAAAPAVDIVGELTKLASLKDAGVLSDEEFAAAKAKLLG